MNRPTNETFCNTEVGRLLDCDTIDWGDKMEDPMEVEAPNSADLNAASPKQGALKSDEPLSSREGMPLKNGQMCLPTCCSVDLQERLSLSRKPKQRVVFSELSSLTVYRPDPLYTREKSYKKTEFRKFGSDTLREAIRIKTLVYSTNPAMPPKDVFKSLVTAGVILPEEFLGIEHLLTGRPGQKLAQERRAHTNAVLAQQRKQQAEAMSRKEDPTSKLGVFAASLTIRSAKSARTRAAMAA